MKDEILDRLKGTRAWAWGQLIEKTETGGYRPVKWITKQEVYEVLYEVQELCRQIKEEDNSPAKAKYKILTSEVLTAVSQALVDSVVKSRCESKDRTPQEKILHELIVLRGFSCGNIELRYREANRESDTDGN